IYAGERAVCLLCDQMVAAVWPSGAFPRNRTGESMNANPNNLRNIVLWIIIGLLLLALFNLFSNQQPKAPPGDMAISELYAAADRGEVEEVTIRGDKITAKMKNGHDVQVMGPKDSGVVVQRLTALTTPNRPKVSFGESDADSPSIFTILVNWFPM